MVIMSNGYASGEVIPEKSVLFVDAVRTVVQSPSKITYHFGLVSRNLMYCSYLFLYFGLLLSAYPHPLPQTPLLLLLLLLLGGGGGGRWGVAGGGVICISLD